MIKAKDVSLVYDNWTIGLKKFSINIKLGDTVYITGPSG